MKLIAVSDLHVGNKGQIVEPRYELAKAIGQLHGDVLYFGGDMADTLETMNRGFDALSKFPGRKVAILGNNDLECLPENDAHKLGVDHENFFAGVLTNHGFELLDQKPAYVGSIAFMGNCGWYEGSLWKPSPATNPDGTPYDPSNIGTEHDNYKSLEEIAPLSEKFVRGLLRNRLPELGTQSANEHILARSLKQLNLSQTEISKRDDIESIIVGVHHIAIPDFVKYGHSRKFDQRNFPMGSTKLAQFYQGNSRINLGFTGHTHRDDVHPIGTLNVQNLSTTKDHPYWTFDI